MQPHLCCTRHAVQDDGLHVISVLGRPGHFGKPDAALAGRDVAPEGGPARLVRRAPRAQRTLRA
jgi:hypothetical protein